MHGETSSFYRAHSFAVTLGADRRETGTHYTPKSLTESIVETTLEPVAYVGPVEGKPREEWQLKSSAELLDLKICDPAMGLRGPFSFRSAAGCPNDWLKHGARKRVGANSSPWTVSRWKRQVVPNRCPTHWTNVC